MLYAVDPGDEQRARAIGSLHQALVSGILVQWLIDPDRAPSGEELAAGMQAMAGQVTADTQPAASAQAGRRHGVGRLPYGYWGKVRQTTGFARMPDAGRIAFAVVGNGPAIVLPAWWVSHLAEDWQSDPLRRFVEGLAARRTVVRYDRVGTGMSDRERPRRRYPGIEAATLCAVLDELRLERMTLMGISCGGCTAVSFAARWPEHVERLVLYGSYANGQTLGPPEARRGMVDLVRSHWGLGSRLLADVFGSSWSPAGSCCLQRSPAHRRRRQMAAVCLS